MKNQCSRRRAPGRALRVFFIGLLRASGRHRRKRPFCWTLGGSAGPERSNKETRDEKRNRHEGEADGGPGGLCCTGAKMKVHLFHLGVTGLLRAWNQCRAGWRLCRAAKKPFRKLFPESINSMTAAWNVWRIFKDDGLAVPGTIWDVGANLNQMTRMILMLNEGAEIVSFEPNPALKPLGKRMMMGISDRNGTAVFSMPGNDSGWGTIESAGAVEKDGKQGQTVPVRRLDSLIENGELAWDSSKGPLFLKIDVEGDELKVLRGMGRHLHDVSYLLLELANGEDRLTSYEAMDLYAVVREAGFARSRIVYACYDGPDAPAYCDVFFWKT